MASALQYVRKCISELETNFVNFVLGRFFRGQLAPALIADPRIQVLKSGFSLEDVLKSSILWAVPKRRRSAQKVRQRKFGIPEYVWKPFVPMTNIVTCSHCGYYYIRGALCGTCYNKVIEETKEMQAAIQEELQLSPVEEEVIVLYEGEKEEQDPEFWNGKRIVEMKKPRPPFFSKNLMEPSTQPNADTSEGGNIVLKDFINDRFLKYCEANWRPNPP